MKKFLVMAVLIFISIASFCQSPSENIFNLNKNEYLTLSQIDNIISTSKDLNHLDNPNLIFPGDTLRYRIFKNLTVTFVVKKGDSQWKILNRYCITSTDRFCASLIEENENNVYPVSLNHFSLDSQQKTEDSSFVKVIGFLISISVLIKLGMIFKKLLKPTSLN